MSQTMSKKRPKRLSSGSTKPDDEQKRLKMLNEWLDRKRREGWGAQTCSRPRLHEREGPTAGARRARPMGGTRSEATRVCAPILPAASPTTHKNRPRKTQVPVDDQQITRPYWAACLARLAAMNACWSRMARTLSRAEDASGTPPARAASSSPAAAE